MRAARSAMEKCGNSAVFSTVELARRAADAGCAALLLSMPYFYRYTQDDIAAYCETVCASVPASFLLYNLPEFGAPLETPTALSLFEAIPNLIGMKDSSGDFANLAPLVMAPARSLLFAGNDSLLLDALRTGWHGAISGVACFAPELVNALVRSHRAGDAQGASDHQTTLNELIRSAIAPLPAPWGIRLGLEARSMATGPLHMSLSAARQRQVAEIRGWLAEWSNRRANQW